MILRENSNAARKFVALLSLVFRNCLYVCEAVFIREFQDFFCMMSQKLGVIGKKKSLVLTLTPPINYRKTSIQMFFFSQIIILLITKKNDSKLSNAPWYGKYKYSGSGYSASVSSQFQIVYTYDSHHATLTKFTNIIFFRDGNPNPDSFFLQIIRNPNPQFHCRIRIQFFFLT